MAFAVVVAVAVAGVVVVALPLAVTAVAAAAVAAVAVAVPAVRKSRLDNAGVAEGWGTLAVAVPSQRSLGSKRAGRQARCRGAQAPDGSVARVERALATATAIRAMDSCPQSLLLLLPWAWSFSEVRVTLAVSGSGSGIGSGRGRGGVSKTPPRTPRLTGEKVFMGRGTMAGRLGGGTRTRCDPADPAANGFPVAVAVVVAVLVVVAVVVGRCCCCCCCMEASGEPLPLIEPAKLLRCSMARSASDAYMAALVEEEPPMAFLCCWLLLLLLLLPVVVGFMVADSESGGACEMSTADVERTP